MAREPSNQDATDPRVTIHVLRGKSSRSSQEMRGQSLLVGSGPVCDVQMRSPEVALKHALVMRSGGGVIVRQLDSEFPVMVNSEPVSEANVYDGDVVRIGPFELSLSIEASPRQESVAASDRGQVKFAELAASDETTTSHTRTSTLSRAVSELSKLAGVRPRVNESSNPTQIASADVARPARVSEIERERQSKEKEIEHRKRQVRDELVKIETERQLLRQERARLEAYRQELERQNHEVSDREAHAIERSHELDARDREIRKCEQELESRRMTTVEDSLSLDRRSEAFDSRFSKFRRVRRRMFDHYRKRLGTLSERAQELEQHAKLLSERQSQHDVDVVHTKRVADELGKRQAELKRLESELHRRLETVERREHDFQERLQRFDRDVSTFHTREKAVEALRLDNERRKTRLAEEETSLKESRKSVEEQLERAKQKSAEVQRRHDEIQGKTLAMEKQEQFLRDRAAAMESQREQLADLDRKLAGRQVEIETQESELHAAREQIEKLHHDLRAREIALEEQTERLKHYEERVKELAAQTGADAREIERRREELEEQASALLAQMRAEREDIEKQRKEVEEMHRSESEQRRLAHDERARWTAKMHEVRETLADSAHRESILAAREQQLDALERTHAVEQESKRTEKKPAVPSHELTASDADVEWDKSQVELEETEVGEAEEPGNIPLSTRSGRMSDEDLTGKLRLAGLLDDPTLRWYMESASQRQRSLEHELRAQGVLTPYQLDRLADDDVSELKLADATVLDEIHVGAVATTYRVRMPNIERPLVARMLKPQWCRDPAQRKQLEIAIDSLKGFRHPNVVGTVGFLLAGERFGTLTDWVHGVPLSELYDHNIPPSVLMEFCLHAAQGLSAAERGGFVHLGIRPSRLLVTETGEVKILGFGEPGWLATIHRCERGRSMQPFLAPEVLKPGQPIDIRADVYSLGKVCTDAIRRETGTSDILAPTVTELYSADFCRLLTEMTANAAVERPKPTAVVSKLDAFVDHSAASSWPDLVLAFEPTVHPTRSREAA